jgi:hypothetical protein
MKKSILISTVVLCLALASQAQNSEDASKKLTALRDSWNRARKDAVAPIDGKYIDTLNKLRRQFVDAGDLHGVLAVDEALKQVTDQPPVAPTTTVEPKLPGKPEPPAGFDWNKKFMGERLPRIREGRELKKDELNLISRVFSGSTWNIEKVSDGRHDYYFSPDGGGNFKSASDKLVDTLEWQLKDDGTVFVTGAGFHKQFLLKGFSEAEVVIRATGGPIEARATRKELRP